MKKINYFKRALWMGTHKNMGGFIYDSATQKGVKTGKEVRLYK